jgi:hypothetical protein
MLVFLAKVELLIYYIIKLIRIFERLHWFFIQTHYEMNTTNLQNTTTFTTTSTTTAPAPVAAATATTITTGNPFENALKELGQSVLASYTDDQNELDPEQLASVNTIVDAVVENATSVFKPLYDQLFQQQLHQQQILDALIRSSTAATAATAPGTSSAGEYDGSRPTVEWLKAHRKSKKDAAVTGYNVFTMWEMANKPGSGFPAKGTWEKEDQAFYKALATEYNLAIGAVKRTTKKMNVGATLGPLATLAPQVTLAPQATQGLQPQKIKKVTGFNVWTKEYMEKNPGKGFPAKGLWSQVSKEEVDRCKAKAKAMQQLVA